MERTSDYAAAATVSPVFEFLSLATLGFAWIYFREWTSVPGSVFSVILLAQIVSLIVGVMHWYSLWRDKPRVAQITLMHGVTELMSLLAGAIALSLFVYTYITALPVVEMDQRVLEEFIASSIFALIGAGFGLVIFWFVMPVSSARFKRTIEN